MNNNLYLAAEGHANDWEEAIRLCGCEMKKYGSVDQRFIDACVSREKEYPTGLPGGIPVAIPHSKADGILKNTVCFLRLDKPVRFHRMDDDDQFCETRLVFNLAIDDADNHLKFLQKLMRFVSDESTMERCLTASIEEIPNFMKRQIG